MPQPTPGPADLQAARGHVRRLRVVLQLCLIAVPVIALTPGVNLAASPHRLSFPRVVRGCAMALALTALEPFRRNPWFGRAWQERKMRGSLARQAR